MVSSRQAASSREPQVASRCLRAAVLLGTWVAVGAASAQVLAPEGATIWQPPAVTLKPAVLDRNAHPDLTPLLRSIKPRVTGGLPGPLWSRLSSAYRVAVERIVTRPSCSTLFTSRGAVGFEILMKAGFAPAARERDVAACAGGAVARTEVGGRQIRLCPRFQELSPTAAALVVIHEALHNAGMSEKPADPTGLTSVEINQLVEASCGP